ncbi:MAG: lipoate--protein ligase family protein [Candidatus Aenigmarchaeota archaeon]|nr:lipoate--protein ligase family protein [Candidatus Aenigmarchaeota archaeon]
MKWRLIEQNEYSAAMNMAIDHAVYESVANERELPTIRFYKWMPSSISLGAYQNPKEINLDACKKHNIGIVRRMTGGRAVFHDKVDFTYSVIAPIRVFNYNIENAYKEICTCIINALNELGIKAAIENKNDIVVNGKKISGNAAKLMNKGIYLQHGTLIYGIDLDVMPEVLNISKEIVKERVASILQHKKLSQNDVYDALKKNFTKSKDFKTEQLSKFELMRVNDLAKTKYSTIMLPTGTLVKNKGACYVERGS